MLTSVNEVTAAQKASVDAFFYIANEAMTGFEKLVQLNFQVWRDSTQRAMNALANGELPGVAAASRGDLSVIERATLYQQQLFGIVANTQAAIIKHASAQYETQIGSVRADLDDAVQRAPAGAEAAVSAMNSAITAANAFYESMWKTAQQAVDMAESNASLVTRSARTTSHAA
ncbi:phasin family protein [Paraburkholderia phymatum]|uniref:Phasin family protein n=1 Tax=Paraburkholderia phymatum (strain DSM 17167 / CIP 108236 / LMG 21445 / STM815) TaxID=391038 RepID=B2JNU1_PARP8|nr:phasin family protein [Paraburkholderia phymatum]ACC73042.1 phasin family protein [Paraburkholderia phymatum STM815]